MWVVEKKRRRLHNVLVYLIGFQNCLLKIIIIIIIILLCLWKLLQLKSKVPFCSNLTSLPAFRPTGTVIDDCELRWTGAAQCNRAPLPRQNALTVFLHWLSNFVFFLPQLNTKINMSIAKTTWPLSSERTFSRFLQKTHKGKAFRNRFFLKTICIKVNFQWTSKKPNESQSAQRCLVGRSHVHSGPGACAVAAARVEEVCWDSSHSRPGPEECSACQVH